MRRITAIANISALAVLTAACSGGETAPAEPADSAEAEAVEEVAAEEGASGEETAAEETTTEEAPAEEASEETAMGAMDTKDGVAFASLTGDASAGKIVFAQCQSCHSVEAGVNKTGPSLAGIVGRVAGSIEDYNYSPSNAESGITWTEEQLYVYLEDPRRVVPKTKMVYPGQADAQKRADVIAYLKNPA
jgi:cytochrome c